MRCPGWKTMPYIARCNATFESKTDDPHKTTRVSNYLAGGEQTLLVWLFYMFDLYEINEKISPNADKQGNRVVDSELSLVLKTSVQKYVA